MRTRGMLAVIVVAGFLGGCSTDATTGATDGSPTVQPAAATTEPTPTPLPLPIEVTAEAAPVKQSGTATLSIKTIGSSDCIIDVQYESGSGTAVGLKPTKADANGVVVWKWRVGSNTQAGTWPIVVTCTLDDRVGMVATDVTVK